ncbi:MAG TPA: hypothetical protein VNN22_26205 [Verrucomicrobiae bacterium]|nr:hypothetical protein [Verrucomicrobiae bacterium]
MDTSLKKVIWISLLCMLVLSAVFVWFQSQRGTDVQRVLADTRQKLRQEGFKTDLADFKFTTDATARARESALTAFNAPRQLYRAGGRLDLMPAAGNDAVIAIWQQNELKVDGDPVDWADLHEVLDGNRWVLDDACAAALSGPIGFDLDASKGSGMLLRHLATLRNLAMALSSREILELHEGHPDLAWTNLLATTHLVTAWAPEPAEISHLVRFGLATIAFNATWQALQTNGWPEAGLAGLQHEWEAVDLFTNVSETAAFRRASVVAICQQQRREPLSGGGSFSDFIEEATRSPVLALAEIKSRFNEARYRSYGTFDDEKNLLLYFQTRELQLRRAIQSPTWAEMSALPGVTNPVPFKSPYPSRLQVTMNAVGGGPGYQRQGAGLLGRAAEAETRRRILITAIALERYRGTHGAYPATLAALVPEFLKTPPMDFMDGEPLRYQLTDDGHFVLYSVGLDRVDDGGTLPVRGAQTLRGMRGGGGGGGGLFGAPQEADIVWPRPATTAELEALHLAEQAEKVEQADDDEERESAWLWQHTDKRQAGVERLLAAPAVTNMPDVFFRGRPLSEILCNTNLPGTDKLSLAEMFTLQPVITGAEPETVTFELPVAFDALTDLGSLGLMLDPDYNATDEEGSGAQQVEYERAPNGNCRLLWSTLYESPGKHALQAALFMIDHEPDRPDVSGPLLPFDVSNLCQFSTGSAHFDQETGVTFHARLAEPNGKYVIECNTTNGTRLKTISGSTTDGFLKAHWDLVDEQGQRFTGDFFDSVFHLTLPDSGRTQTLKGP